MDLDLRQYQSAGIHQLRFERLAAVGVALPRRGLWRAGGDDHPGNQQCGHGCSGNAAVHWFVPPVPCSVSHRPHEQLVGIDPGWRDALRGINHAAGGFSRWRMGRRIVSLYDRAQFPSCLSEQSHPHLGIAGCIHPGCVGRRALDVDWRT